MAVSDKPWSSFTAADYSVEQWHRACLIHLHSGSAESKSECKLPVREPSGVLNRNALGAAAAVLAGARGGVQAPAPAKRAAARRLTSLYREADMEPPDSLKRLAG